MRQWISLLPLILLGCNANTDALLLAQTVESFKLADLMLLEAQWLCPSSRRLLLDAATARQWLLLEDREAFFYSNDRLEWTGKVLCCSSGDHDAILAVEDLPVLTDAWTLTYHRGSEARGMKTSYKEARLAWICHALGANGSVAPALDPGTAGARLRLVELVDADGDVSFYLTQDVDMPVTKLSSSDNFISRWKQRPYQYSSSINPVAAEIVIQMLHARGARCLWDATCGAGTFLAAALWADFHVVAGTDVNPRCIEGSRRNLEHMLGAAKVESGARLLVADSRSVLLQGEVDSVVCNLPWGINTPRHDGNDEILRNICRHVPRGTLCAILSKDILCLDRFRVLGQATIPPQGFELPLDKKRQRQADKTGRSDCVVTFAETR